MSCEVNERGFTVPFHPEGRYDVVLHDEDRWCRLDNVQVKPHEVTRLDLPAWQPGGAIQVQYRLRRCLPADPAHRDVQVTLVAIDSCGRRLEFPNTRTPEFVGLTSPSYALNGLWPDKWNVELHCHGKPIAAVPVTIHGTEATGCWMEVHPLRVDQVRLDLWMEHKDGKALLHVKVVNVGPYPIVVDRKLEFGVWVSAVDDRGDVAPLTVLPPSPRPDRPWNASQWNERTVKLGTGQSTTRVLDLFGGYDVYGESFEYGIVYSRTGIDQETLRRKGRRLRFISASYRVTDNTLRGLKQYYLEPNVPVDQLERAQASRVLDVTTGKMIEHEEMIKILERFDQEKGRKSEAEKPADDKNLAKPF
jgi:hypothetical protein